jgi:Arc/MetJ family transcription regulator
MRTNIELDDEPVDEAMRVSGQKTKKAVVEEARRRMVTAARKAQAVRTMRGLGWEGDLDALRTTRA